MVTKSAQIILAHSDKNLTLQGDLIDFLSLMTPLLLNIISSVR